MEKTCHYLWDAVVPFQAHMHPLALVTKRDGLQFEVSPVQQNQSTEACDVVMRPSDLHVAVYHPKHFVTDQGHGAIYDQ